MNYIIAILTGKNAIEPDSYIKVKAPTEDIAAEQIWRQYPELDEETNLIVFPIH